MRELCPVCKTEVAENDIKCKNCGFDDLHKIFISKIDAEEWIEKIVTPKRKEYEQLQKTIETTSTKEVSPVEKLKAEVDSLNSELNSYRITTQKELDELQAMRNQLGFFKFQQKWEIGDKINQLNNERNSKINRLQSYINVKNTKIKLHQAKIGDTVFFGSYPQDLSYTKKCIEWIILDKEDDKFLLLSKYCLDMHPGNHALGRTNSVNTNYVEDKTWTGSVLRNWCNSTFYNTAFNNIEKNMIVNSKIINEDKEGYYTTTYDNVFVLSPSEVRQYFKDLNDCKTTGTSYAVNKFHQAMRSFCQEYYHSSMGHSQEIERRNFVAWWLRPRNGWMNTMNGSIVSSNKIFEQFRNLDIYIYLIRPAIWVFK